jgi:hypothetical protein
MRRPWPSVWLMSGLAVAPDGAWLAVADDLNFDASVGGGDRSAQHVLGMKITGDLDQLICRPVRDAASYGGRPRVHPIR